MSARGRAIASITLWTLALLAGMDFVVGRLAAYPKDPRQRPNDLQAYFEYGRSLEGKLDRLLGAGPGDEAPILSAGWLDTNCGPPAAPGPGRLGVTFYGMSFSNHVAVAFQAIRPDAAVALRSAPSATVSDSYACFRRVDDARADPNPVVVLGVLASSIPHLPTMTGLTTAFEAPTPYTYPRYAVSPSGAPVATTPLLTSLEQWRDPVLRRRFFDQLAANDRYYDRLLVEAGPLDESVLVRMARRAYAQHVAAAHQAAIAGDGAGARDDPDLGPVAIALLADFSARARAHGQLPIVLLIQDRPGVDALDRLLVPALAARGIVYLSTRTIVPTTDPANFLGDGHFNEAADRRIAERLLSLIEAHRPQTGAPAASGASPAR